MFKNEIAALRRIDTLTDELCDVASTLRNVGEDLDTFFEDFLGDEDMLDSKNADYMVGSAVRTERAVAKDLARFDRLLNRVIAERVKLGNFEVTL